MGAGEAMVGRRVRKAIGSRGISEGHVYSYDVSSRLYQVLQPFSHSNMFKATVCMYSKREPKFMNFAHDNHCR